MIMNSQILVKEIYKTMKENLDIINIWFENDNQKLDKKALFTYVPKNYNNKLGNEDSIYEFINKFMFNLMAGNDLKIKKLNYLEENFLSLFTVVMDEYKGKDAHNGS